MEDLIVSRWTWEFPEVQWLRLSAFTSMAQVQSLVGELRFCKSHGAAKKKKKMIDLFSKLVVYFSG